MSEDYPATERLGGAVGSQLPHQPPARPAPDPYKPTVAIGDQGGGSYAPHQPGSGAPYAAGTEVLRPSGPLVLAWLVVVSGPYVGHIFRLLPESTVIGRDPSCDIVLDETAASRQHAKIRTVIGEDKQARFALHDMASANGTLLNGEDVIKSDLSDGDTISIGRTELVFKQVVPKEKED